jgi:hypothetical protein
LEEENIDEKLEIEEEEAIYQLALSSLWTSQAKSIAVKNKEKGEEKVFGMSTSTSRDSVSLMNALANEKARCNILIAERDEANQSVARSEEAMRSLLKGISSMKTFYAQRVTINVVVVVVVV